MEHIQDYGAKYRALEQIEDKGANTMYRAMEQKEDKREDATQESRYIKQIKDNNMADRREWSILQDSSAK